MKEESVSGSGPNWEVRDLLSTFELCSLVHEEFKPWGNKNIFPHLDLTG